MHGHTISSATFGAASLWAAFALGLSGGFGHCLAMCGPLVAGASLGSAARRLSDERPPSALLFQTTYHVGRLITYTAIGALLGLLGQAGALSTLGGAFSPVALTRYLKFGAGLATIALGVWLLVGWLRKRGVRLPEPSAALANTRWFQVTAARLASPKRGWGLRLGMLMGLLPCAPLLPVELAALATGWPLLGALLMLAFGLGTVPALAGLGAASGLIGRRAQGWLGGAVALAVIALGAVTMLQGVSLLGI